MDVVELWGRYMRGGIVIVSLTIVFIFFFLSSVTLPPEVSITVQTDKQDYQSKDMMYIYLTISSTHNINNATIRLHGIPNIAGVEYIDQSKEMSIGAGISYANFTQRLPTCSSCSGLSAGPQPITVEVMVNNTAIASANHSINLE